MNRDLTPLEKKARETIIKYKMLENVKAVLVGVSGGADSMSLLSFLCSIREEFGIKVYGAHVNHGLRGKEADRDENFVKSWCSEHDVELFVLHADVKKLAKEHGRAVEEEGRFVRYDFFKKKSSELGAVTATAHTLSDTIETQIMNYARGAGMHGLLGIPVKRGTIIRPLIRATRKETEEYCAACGIKYVTDSTNFSRDFTRNRVRLDLVPMLYSINPSFEKAAARLLDSLEEDEECLNTLSEKRLKKAYIRNGEYRIDALLNNTPRAVLNRCIAKAAAEFTNKAQEAKHISAIIEILLKGSGKTEIVGGCFAECKKGVLKFYFPVNNRTQNCDFNIPFAVGIYKINDWELSISTISHETIENLKNVNKEYFKNAVDCDKINGNATVRSKKQKDRFSPVGRNCTKSLKKLFNEEKIPVNERSALPIAADENGVFWISGIGVSEGCRITEKTKNAVLMQIKKPGGNQLAK